MNEPLNKPGNSLGPGSLGDLLRKELKVGELASVLSGVHKNGTEIDANLYKKFSDGRVYRIDKIHLNPKNLSEK